MTQDASTRTPRVPSPLRGRARRKIGDKTYFAPIRTPEQQRAIEQKLAKLTPEDLDRRGPSLLAIHRKSEARLIREARRGGPKQSTGNPIAPSSILIRAVDDIKGRSEAQLG